MASNFSFSSRLRLEALEDRWNLSPLDLSAAVAPASASRPMEQLALNYTKIEFGPSAGRGEIEIQSYSWGAIDTAGHGSGGGGGAGKVQVQDVSFVAKLSSADLGLTAGTVDPVASKFDAFLEIGSIRGETEDRDAGSPAPTNLTDTTAPVASPKLLLSCATGQHIEAGDPSDLAAAGDDSAAISGYLKVKKLNSGG